AARGTAAGPGALERPPSSSYSPAGDSSRSADAAPADHRTVSAPAIGRAVRSAPSWAYHLAPTGRGRPGVAAALAGQHLEPKFLHGGPTAPIHRSQLADSGRGGVARRRL